jgi:flagellar protein FliS
LSRNDPLRSYKETQIKTATPGKLVVMLYDGAVKYLSLALEALNSRHHSYDRVSEQLIRTQDIITELMVSLDFERGGDIARSLFNLYMWMNRQLLDGNIRKDTAPLESVRAVLRELRYAWAETADKAGAEAPARNAGGVNIAG